MTRVDLVACCNYRSSSPRQLHSHPDSVLNTVIVLNVIKKPNKKSLNKEKEKNILTFVLPSFGKGPILQLFWFGIGPLNIFSLIFNICIFWFCLEHFNPSSSYFFSPSLFNLYFRYYKCFTFKVFYF